MSKQRSSDPLPYVQVDRAVKPKASLLADALGVSRQHALGSLIEWWELCGDPRELETIVAQSPEDAEHHAVILQADEVSARFRLASGKDVEPISLVRLGLLEQLPGGFRVRGMSRYFEPIRKRVQARHAAVAGGLARAGAPREGGRFVSKTTVTGAGALAGVSAGDFQPSPQPPTSRPPADHQPTHQPTHQPLASREPALADSGQRSAVVFKEEPAKPSASQPSLELVGETLPKPKASKPPDPRAEFERFAKALTPDEGTVFEAYETAAGVELGADWGLRKLVGQKLRAHTADELCAAIRGYLADPWKRENSPSLRAILRDATVIAINAKKARGVA